MILIALLVKFGCQIFVPRVEVRDMIADFRLRLRVRLWPCKIDLNPPVTLCYRSFQVDTSVVVLFVSCLGV